MKKFVFVLLLISVTSYAQTWEIYSDSIYSNIQNFKNEKAKEFLILAEKELEKITIIKDTTYADFLYRKGLVHYFVDNIKPLKIFEESLEIWNSSGFINPTKLMKTHFFLGENYKSKEKYDLAYENYEKCYVINKTYKIPLNSNYISSLYILALYDYYDENFDKAKKYSLEYIDLIKDKANKKFDYNYINALKFAQEYTEQEKYLLFFLNNYNQEKLNNPALLFDMNNKLSEFYSDQEKILEMIDHGEKALELLRVNNFGEGFYKSIYTRLIWGYNSIGNNIKEKEYKEIYNKLYPKDEVDYYDELENIIAQQNYELFQRKFIEYESILISKNDFNTLITIYAISLSLFERSVLFSREDIEHQISKIENNKEYLNEEYLEFFPALIAEFSFFTKDYLKTLQVCNTLILKTKDDALRLNLYKYKSLSEMLLGIPSATETSYETLRLATEIYGGNSPQILPFLNVVLIVNNLKLDKKVYEISTQALEIISNNGLEKSNIASEIFLSLGELAKSSYNYNDAILYYKKSIEIQENNGVINDYYYYSALLGLAVSYTFTTDFENSLKFLDKTKIYLDSKPNIMNLAYGDYYYYLGRYYFNQDKWELSKNAYKKSLDIYGSTLGKGRDYEYIICDYFLNYDVNKTIFELENYYKVNGDLNGSVLKILYLLKYNIDLVDEARELLNKNIKSVIEENNVYFHLLSDTERELVYSKFSDQFEFLNTHLLLNNDISFVNQFIDFRFYYKSLLFNNSSNKYNDISNLSNYNELKNNKVLLNKYYESEKNYSTDINVLLSRNRELEKFLAQNRTPINIFNLQDLNNHLKNNEAYVEIIRINKQSKSEIENKDKLNILNTFTDSIYYGAIIIKKNIEPKFIIIDDKNQLEDRYLKYYQNHITGSNKFLKDIKSYSLFFEPIDKELSGIDKIYLSTDGVYNSINVETFYNSEKDKYVIDYLNVKQVLSAKSILNLSKDHFNNSELTAAIIGNPEFELDIVSNQNNNEIVLRDFNLDYFRENSGSKTISYLPGTEKEIISISDILRQKQWDVQLYSNENASEENLKNINSPTVLHIATHGYFLDAPKIDNSKMSLLGVQTNHLKSNVYLRSGLLFSGAQNTVDGNVLKDSDNGIFTAQEAKSLNLEDTDLVVLSACETGLGENQSGEGVYGLQRAFMIAGAKSIIMSLWKVNDETTQTLMTSFYTNWIQKKISKSEAFKLAKLDLKKDHPEPFYWAPFVLIE